MSPRCYVVITPVRDEARFLGRTIESMTRQTILPREWIVVNDGSQDGTGEILDSASAEYPWIRVLHLEDRGFRKSGGGVVEAFYQGYKVLADHDWDLLAKLDGDLSFGPDYFESCFLKFEADPKLGIGGGLVYVEQEGQLRVDSPHDPPFHVRGATKIYRKACWERIAPLPSAPGWDTIDEIKANMFGWRTKTFTDVPLIQHKPTGVVDGVWKNWYKNGRGSYLTGYDPVFMLAKCASKIFRAPLASAALLAGFGSGYLYNLRRRVDPETLSYLRRQQRCRLLLRPSIYRR
jgi:poly-beta-1,6-N-acetyl-D-glucosamine synthase